MTKQVEFTNSVDPDEAARYEPPHQGLHCLSSGHMILGKTFIVFFFVFFFADVSFVVCFFGA